MPRYPVLALALYITLSAGLQFPSHAQNGTADYVQLLQKAERLMKDQNWSEAGPLWEQVTAKNPSVGEYWSQQGRAWYQAKEYRKSIPAYEKALELRDGFPFNAAYNIACCYGLLGEKSKAMEWLEKSFKLGWRDLQHAQTDDDLKLLRNDPKFREMTAMVDTSKMSREEGWRYDLNLLWRELKRLHYDLRRKTDLTEYESYVKRLDAGIPKLSDNQVMAKLMQLAQMAGDGHTGIRPSHQNRPGLPIQPYQFAEGIFITATTPEQADLLGSQILKVGDHDIADVAAALTPLVSRDNSMGLQSISPAVLRRPALLNGLNLIPDENKETLTIKDREGKLREITLDAVPGEPSESWSLLSKTSSNPLPLYLKNRTSPYWFEYLPDQKTVFFQYNAVRSELKDPLDKFCDRMFKFIADNDVQKLVIDLRWNGGGNTFLNKPIIHGLIKCDKINQKGKLFVIVGRQTFSAAQNCATFIERNTNATFVGEPTGSSPNFVGETVRITLPYSKMEGSISDLYWQSSWPMDYRTWIAPTLYAPPTFELYKQNRDPAMEAILAYPS
jgi:tetratricopeptide (TPR) repeat protein